MHPDIITTVRSSGKAKNTSPAYYIHAIHPIWSLQNEEIQFFIRISRMVFKFGGGNNKPTLISSDINLCISKSNTEGVWQRDVYLPFPRAMNRHDYPLDSTGVVLRSYGYPYSQLTMRSQGSANRVHNEVILVVAEFHTSGQCWM